MPTRPISSIARSRAAALETFSWARICSAICPPTRCTGLRAEIGSWKIIAISLPRMASSLSSGALTRSSPRSRAVPAKRAFGERVSPISVITVTDLPEPDSPTMATVSPRLTEKETPLTARTRPSSVANETWRSSISSSRSFMAHHLAVNPDPGIEQGVHHVGERAEQHDEEGGEHRADHDRRHVELPDRVGLVLADAGQVEHGLGDQRGPAEQGGEVQPEQGDDRHQRVAQHMADEYLPCGQALGPGRAHVVLVDHVERVGAQHPGVEADEQDRDGEPRENQVVGPL